mgnify:CR=1 FL=1
MNTPPTVPRSRLDAIELSAERAVVQAAKAYIDPLSPMAAAWDQLEAAVKILKNLEATL